MKQGVISNTSFEEIGGYLRKAKSVLLTSHLRPDGDAIGSVVGMALSLKKLGKDVRILNQDGVPESLSFLPGSEMIETPETVRDHVQPDLIIACDTAAEKRLGDSVRELLPENVTLINIDHHISNECYGDFHYVDSLSPATGQIVFELLHSEGMPVDKAVSENLFAAISTDTGSFQYPNTTSDTYRVGAALIDQGVSVGSLSQDLYENYPLRRVLLLGELLKVLIIGNQGRRASWGMSLELSQRLEIQAADTDGLIDHIRSIQGVVVAAFFQEMPDGFVRASLRSKDERVDVCAICQKFKGGGHRLAAGVRLRCSLEEAQTKVLQAIDEALEGIH